jgi:hypothetical protein
MNMDAFWNVAPRSLLEIEDVSEVRTVSIIREMMMMIIMMVMIITEAVFTSEKSVYFYESNRHNIQGGLSS